MAPEFPGGAGGFGGAGGTRRFWFIGGDRGTGAADPLPPHGAGESSDLGDIEDLRHLMRRSGFDRGVFITPGYFAPGLRHAMRNATDVELLDGANLLELLRSAPDDRTTRALFAIATEGNYWIPTCHQCGSKMKKVEKKCVQAQIRLAVPEPDLRA
ncbi:MAG: restriction endonuclease [Verrucomicrobiales bacterium]